MENIIKEQLQGFQEAKNIALKIGKGLMRRASINSVPCNYCGFKDGNGRMWVIGDSIMDIQNPDATINGFPAREIFGDFTVMSK